ncbi:sensor histidine kinase [Dyadobacter psychrotolerans]|uniref:histidine kinase n=1 Tax=Dyadobacter psychrotolerans TaxID=2541721 RepID=A0A4R5DZI8_9BACT|nr:PAS domain-containing sensor histidine kinase [Dyadobacter psychrotolerans]TDE17990.1 PAS domain S-box protein [Dyadobacter psychrotolerans]
MSPYPNSKRIEFLATLVTDHITAMIAYWDKDLICRFANASYLKWFGKRSEDMVDKITLSELLGPLYEKNLPYIEGALRGDAQIFEREIPLPTGEPRYSLASYFPDIEDGKVIGFFVHVADVHEMKLLEKELIKSNEVVTEQNKQLKNFANIVSHNLRSYSGNLGSLLQLLDIVDTEDEKAVILNYLRDLSKSFSATVDHLTEIVNYQNQQERPHVSCNLLQYVNETITILKLQIDSCNAVIQIKVESRLNLMTNPAYLESILLNLITNALKYRHPQRRPDITIQAWKTNTSIVLDIRDNGLGIDLNKHGKSLFGMNQTFHGNADAHGIGLYITKYQIDSLGGGIVVESEVDLGSTFRVTFN